MASEIGHDQRKRLVAQWLEGGRALAELRQRELADASPQEHREAVWDMSQLGGLVEADARRERWSGMIEMQRWFARLRERGAK